MTDFPWGNLITAVSTVSGVWATLWFTTKSNRSAKLIELRAAAYSEITGLVSDAVVALDELIAADQEYEPDEQRLRAARRAFDASLEALTKKVRQAAPLLSTSVSTNLGMVEMETLPSWASGKQLQKAKSELEEIGQVIMDGARSELQRHFGSSGW